MGKPPGANRPGMKRRPAGAPPARIQRRRPSPRRDGALPVIILRGERNSRHPWVYGRMLDFPDEPLDPGTVVEARTRAGRFVGRGFYNPESTIALRLLTEDPAEPVDAALFRDRIGKAAALRRALFPADETDGYRLVHSEGDGLSGLVIDRYGDIFVVEPYSAGYRGEIMRFVAEAVEAECPGARVVVRPDPRTEEKERCSFRAEAGAFPGPERCEVREYDLVMSVDLRGGHKTGFFLDQKRNRRLARDLAAGRTALDLCSYTGGFGISMALGGAASVTSVDLDPAALAVAAENARRNGVALETRRADVFEFLRGYTGAGRRAGMIVLDPAKLAGCRDEIARAFRTYGDMNKLAIGAVEPGGFLLTCSCSGLVSERDFLAIVSRAAAEADRILQFVEVRGAPPDHPFSSVFPEGRYLKAILARVW